MKGKQNEVKGHRTIVSIAAVLVVAIMLFPALGFAASYQATTNVASNTIDVEYFTIGYCVDDDPVNNILTTSSIGYKTEEGVTTIGVVDKKLSADDLVLTIDVSSWNRASDETVSLQITAACLCKIDGTNATTSSIYVKLNDSESQIIHTATEGSHVDVSIASDVNVLSIPIAFYDELITTSNTITSTSTITFEITLTVSKVDMLTGKVLTDSTKSIKVSNSEALVALNEGYTEFDKANYGFGDDYDCVIDGVLIGTAVPIYNKNNGNGIVDPDSGEVHVIFKVPPQSKFVVRIYVDGDMVGSKTFRYSVKIDSDPGYMRDITISQGLDIAVLKYPYEQGVPIKDCINEKYGSYWFTGNNTVVVTLGDGYDSAQLPSNLKIDLLFL